MSADSKQIPPALSGILDWWLPGVRGCVGDKLYSVVLFGSVTLGDYCPGWSDVDVCVVLREPITPEEGDAVGRWHDRMRDLYVGGNKDGWTSGQVIEAPYVSLRHALDAASRMPGYFAGTKSRRWEANYALTPYDRYMLALFGQTYAGEPVAFAPPAQHDLIAQARADVVSVFAGLRDPAGSPIGLAGALHWIARSIVFWRDGRMLSKSEALRHEIERDSPYADAFRLALAVRREGSGSAPRYAGALRGHADRIAADAELEIRQYIDRTEEEL